MKLHAKIAEVKQRAAAINYRSLAVTPAGVLEETDLDKRIVKGYLVIWDKPNAHKEVFVRGAFAKSIREHGPGSNAAFEIKFLYQHDGKDALALFNVLKEDEQGLYFETKPLDDVPNADRTIKQLRSKTLNNFSIGFNYVWDKMKYVEAEDLIYMYEANLYEGSIVSTPSDANTYAIRSVEELEDLYDITEDFIKTLNRKQRLEAREIFARHKALANIKEPLKHRAIALVEESKPPPSGKVSILNKIKIENIKL